MTLKQFNEQTKDLDPKTIIIVSSDAEGNSFEKMSRFSKNLTYYDGELFDEDDLKEDGGVEIRKKGKKCMVIWPV